MENQIGKGLMAQKNQRLELAGPECDLCLWLERGYRTAQGITEIEGYATEILIHRQSLHVFSSANIN